MRKAFQVHGRVQGVGFRWHVQEQARLLGLSGWVRNQVDGTVGGEVEGEAEALEVFRRALEEGPPMAHVLRLDWTPLDGGQSLPLPFELRR